MVMQYTTVLDLLPLWGLFLTILALVLAAIEGGYRLGSYRHRQAGHEKEAPVGAMVGATLGLLAFMLAFTFGMAASRFDTRKQLVLDEANAIGTTYLRAAMLQERRDEIRALLRSYVDARLEAVRPGRVAEGILRSEELQGQMWSAATAVGLQHPDSIVVGLFVESLNEVIDLHAKRVNAGLEKPHPRRHLGGPADDRRAVTGRHGLSRRAGGHDPVDRHHRRGRHLFRGHRPDRRFGPPVRKGP